MAGNTPLQRHWWQDALIYQVYVRSFADSTGDGIGDIEGIRSRLDHLDSLGIDAIWLILFASVLIFVESLLASFWDRNANSSV